MKRLLLSIALFLGVCLLFYVVWVHATLSPPVFEAIPLQNVNENSALVIHIYSTVTADDSIIVKCPNLPSGAVLYDSGTAVTPHWGAGTITWTPSYSQAGIYTFNVYDSSYAFAGGGKDTVGVSITVANVNRIPVPVAIGTKAVLEGAALSIHVWATDADAEAMTWAVKAGQLPSGAVFTDSGTGGGLFTWTPNYTQAGQYTPYFRVTDVLSGKDSTQATINVWNVSRKPVIYDVITAKKTVAENAVLTDTIHSYDADADPLTITSTALPTRATLTDSVFVFSPNYSDSGHYSIDFFVSDTTGVGALEDTISVVYTVVNTNRPPTLASIGAKSVNEGAVINIHTWVLDADGDSVVYSIAGLPTGAVFTDSGDGGGLFTWTPTYSQSGVYHLQFRSWDKQGPDSTGVLISADSEAVDITVANVALTILAISDQNAVDYDSTFTQHVYSNVTDVVSLKMVGLPSTATFTDSGTGGGLLTWTPSYLESGIYTIYLIAEDQSGTIDSELVMFTVVDTTRTLGYLINSINTTPGSKSIVCDWGKNGFLIEGDYGAGNVDTSDAVFIRDYSLYYTTYRASMLGVGSSHSRVRIYGQTSTNGSYWATADSIYPAQDDTLPTVKTWSIPKVDWFRTITVPWVNNDTSRVWLEHSFREKQ